MSVAFILVAATLESVFAYCLGCKIFALLMRAGVIPESVCVECGDIWNRRPRAPPQLRRLHRAESGAPPRPTPGTRRRDRWPGAARGPGGSRRRGSTSSPRSRTRSPRRRGRPPPGSRASLVGSSRHSRWLRSITQRAGDLALVAALPLRSGVDEERAAFADRGGRFRGRDPLQPGTRVGEELVDVPGHPRIIAVRRVPSERRAQVRSASARARSPRARVEVHGLERRRVHVHARGRGGRRVHDAVHVAGTERTRGAGDEVLLLDEHRREVAPASTSRAARPRRRRARRSSHRDRGGRRPGTSPSR